MVDVLCYYFGYDCIDVLLGVVVEGVCGVVVGVFEWVIG